MMNLTISEVFIMPTLLDPVYEILAKEVVYAIDNSQTTIAANAFLAAAGYKIDQQFNDPTTGFQALGLTSLTPDKPPVLVVRGADEIVDDVANADTRGIGFNQVAANRDAIATWLNKFSNATLKPDLVGHSLGGAVAQTIAAELVGQYGNVTTFNSPGINNSTVAKFQQSAPTQSITHYIVNGDLVSLGGEGYLPGTAILQTYTDGTTVDPIFALNKHAEFAAGRRLLSTPPDGYSQTVISVADLSNIGFNFNNETDFKEFLSAYGATPNNVASRLNARGNVESLRTTPGFSFLQLIFGARSAVGLNQANVLAGDDRNNIANGKQKNDLLIGNGGDDQLLGGEGNDRLVGSAGNDQLVGGAGRDRLTGVDSRVADPGRGERDRMEGGGGRDLFILGDEQQVFYNDGIANNRGKSDVALISDFKSGDRVQLRGEAADYRLRTINRGLGIFLRTDDKPELIGIIQNPVQVTLESDRFVFV